MNIIITIVVILCGTQIFFKTGQQRLNWFLCSILLLYSSIVVTEKPHITAHRFFILVYWLSIFYHKEKDKIKGFPLKLVLVIYGICVLLSCVSAPQLSAFYKLYKPFMYLVDGYMLLLLGYTFKNEGKIATNPVRISIYIVTIYGILVWFAGMDPIREMFDPVYDPSYYYGVRSRVGSLWSHPIAYGYVCSLLTILLLYDYKKKDRITLFVLLAINVFICGSRTAIVCYFVMMSIYWFFFIDAKKKIQIGILGTVLAFFLLQYQPFYEKIADTYLSASGNENVGGSSMDMRTTQLAAVVAVSMNFPILGGGLDYVQEVMGYGTEDWQDPNFEFAGLESYLFMILIERGWIGIMAESLIIIFILLVFYKHRKTNPQEFSFALPAVLGFLIFAIMTGKLDSATLPIFLTGIMMSRLELKHHKRIIVKA